MQQSTESTSDLSQQQQQQQQQMLMQHYQQQQQWMGMAAYPAAAIAMQQQQMMMMYNPHHHPYMAAYGAPPQHQQQHQPRQQHHPRQQLNGGEEVRTLWMGDLLHWMDENYLHSCFAPTGEVTSVKIIRNKQTGQSEGYGFIEFLSRAAAEKVLQSYTSSVMPNTDQPYRLNWATFGAVERRPASDTGADLSIFVGDLAPDVTDSVLQETFASRYPSVRGAKVVIDPNTGRPKGYGFVRFGDENERTRAMTEMNGMYCSSRPMRIGVATPKKSPGSQQQYSSQAVILAGGNASNGMAPQGTQSDADSTNTTIFVGGLDSELGEEDLRQHFSQFGDVVSVKIPNGRGCGFVQFANRSNAEDAIQGLNGTIIGKQTVRLSWGRTQANKQWRTDSGNQWNGSYYGGQSYNGYAHAVSPNQNGSVYASAAAYGAS